MAGEKFIPKTKSGLNMYDVVSAFQKCIRRSMVHESMWFGTELLESGFAKYGWYRMQVIAMEDIGLANNNAIVQVNACKQAFEDFEKYKKISAMKLPFVHAILILVNSRKSRVTDNLLCKYTDLRSSVHPPELPDFVFDMFTQRGKQLKRGNDFFFDVSGKIQNPQIDLLLQEEEIKEHVQYMYQCKDNGVKHIVDTPQEKLF